MTRDQNFAEVKCKLIQGFWGAKNNDLDSSSDTLLVVAANRPSFLK